MNLINQTHPARVSRSEWTWVLGASAVILALASLPYLAGYLSQSNQLVFSGTVFDRMDFASHLSGIRMGIRGEWRYQLLYTSDTHPGGYIKQFYLSLGHLARLTRIPPLAAFHLARFGIGLALMMVIYRFAAMCFRPIALRRTMLLFFGLGSGLGWAQLLFGWVPQPDISPIDFWHIDGYGFFSLLTFPHITLVFCLVTIAVIYGVRWLVRQRLKSLFISGSALIALQLVQPFSPAIADAALIGFVLLSWFIKRRFQPRQIGLLAALGFVQLPLFVYQFSFFNTHPLWRSFTEQNITLSPPPVYYVWGYGLLVPLTLWGGWLAVRRSRDSVAHLAVAWLLTGFALAYSPLLIQRRFTEGIMVPISLLATIGLAEGFLPWIRNLSRTTWRQISPPVWRRTRRITLALVIALSSLSSLYLSLGGALLAVQRAEDLFEPVSVIIGVNWLGEHSDWRSPVFSSNRTGTVIVGGIGHKVYLGHPVETIRYEGKLASVRAYFEQNTPEATRRQVLYECGCEYVFYGPHERSYGRYDPSTAAYLEAVFNRGEVVIFRVSYDALTE